MSWWPSAASPARFVCGWPWVWVSALGACSAELRPHHAAATSTAQPIHPSAGRQAPCGARGLRTQRDRVRGLTRARGRHASPRAGQQPHRRSDQAASGRSQCVGGAVMWAGARCGWRAASSLEMPARTRTPTLRCATTLLFARCARALPVVLRPLSAMRASWCVRVPFTNPGSRAPPPPPRRTANSARSPPPF